MYFIHLALNSNWYYLFDFRASGVIGYCSKSLKNISLYIDKSLKGDVLLENVVCLVCFFFTSVCSIHKTVCKIVQQNSQFNMVALPSILKNSRLSENMNLFFPSTHRLYVYVDPSKSKSKWPFFKAVGPPDAAEALLLTRWRPRKLPLAPCIAPNYYSLLFPKTTFPSENYTFSSQL